MANLPTAYASQRFGRKTLDFYAVEGDVVGADPRARSDERRLEDMDGQRHTVRLMEKGFELEPGQTATVLRMQPGPARRSRPVAVVNHDTASWCRTHPGAEGLLAKAGVSRTFNWVLTMGLFALAALVLVWPFLRSFLIEVDPSLFGSMPGLNAAELAAAALPALTGWSFSEVIAPITGPLGAAVPALAGLADMLVFGTGVLVAAFGVYLLRSWRLLWAPLFVAALGAVALGYGGVAGMVGPALSGLGLAALVFLLGGVINRIRDGARLEARIAVLSDHLLRQGPQDVVVPVEDSSETDAEEPANDAIDAVVPAAVATAASLREPGEGGGEEITPDAPVATDVEDAEAGDVQAEADPEDAPDAGLEPEAVDAEVADAPEAADAADAPEAADEQAVAEAPVTEEAVDAEAAEAVEAAEPVDTSEADTAAAETSEVHDDRAAVEPPTEAQAEAPGAEPVSEVDSTEADAAMDAEQAPEQTDTAVEPAQPAEAEAVPEPAEAEPAEAEPASADPEIAPASESEAEVPRAETDPVEPATHAVSEAPLPGDTAPAGLDPEEAERLRTDPRYASRAIVLPPPPPMPAPSPALGEGSGEAVGHGETTTLKPSAPLPDNVIPIFAAPASSEISTDGETQTEAPTAPGDDDTPREPS